MASTRTLHVRCATWEQVEVFHTRKLRRGKLLSMKVPFRADPGSEVTLNLELPNQVVIVVEGVVLKASSIEADARAKADAGKTWLEVELVGFTDEVIARIRRMAAGGDPAEEVFPSPPSAPRTRTTGTLLALSGEDLPADERALFQQLTAELRRLRSVAVHEVLGVDRDADADQIRIGWMNLVRRHHPDLVARRNAPAITHLAEEITILVNRAYDRLRVALVAEGRAASVGPALTPPPGWLVGFEDISSTGSIKSAKVAQTLQNGGNAPQVEPLPPPRPSSAPEGGEAFELRARAMLSDGDAANAQEVLAAALCVYPRSRPLRSLYYVASAISALAKGEVMLATSQLETALAHHEHCTEAAEILELLRRPNAPPASDEMTRLFR
ncbi:MAG: J domain-containing protein [Deltaproteobacteria bacterium]|nr:MAG: J domain-containing protein [Deltaproteobacteria bacterium]